jgi:hypothetical protein
MPERDSSDSGSPDLDRQEDIRKVAKILREGSYSYDQSATSSRRPGGKWGFLRRIVLAVVCPNGSLLKNKRHS